MDGDDNEAQKKAFTKWVNSELSKIDEAPINDLYRDIRDGTKLLRLLQALTSKHFKPEKGQLRVHYLNNVNTALKELEQNGVKLVNISSEAIVDANGKLILGLIWNIILRWPGEKMDLLTTDHQHSSMERALLKWCQKSCQNYSAVNIQNFTTCWTDGVAFLSLIDRWHPSPRLFDYQKSMKIPALERLELAFTVANDRLKVPRLLDPEDVIRTPDKKAIMMYVMQLFQSLSNEADIKKLEEVPEKIRPSSTGFESRPLSMLSFTSVEYCGYQAALEDVLTWLLAAEDRLAQQSTVLPQDLSQLKEIFREHESFLLHLSEQQEGVGAVLSEGARILGDEPQLSNEDAQEIRLQMNLLNARWENLRVAALDRQGLIHNALRNEQRARIDELRKWLTNAENQATKVKSAKDIALNKRMEKFLELKVDVEKQKINVENMADIVVIVDEKESDNEFSEMEDELTALGERWTHLCNWIEKEYPLMHQLQTLIKSHETEKDWLNKREKVLKYMEAHPAVEIADVLNRIKKLQILKHELDDSHLRLQQLQDEIDDFEKKYGKSNKDALKQLQSSIELLFDRWDALVQIVEVQAHRIENSGFEINLSSVDKFNILGSSSQWELRSVSNIDLTSKESKKPRLADSKTAISEQEINETLKNITDWLKQTEYQLNTTNKDFKLSATSSLSNEEHIAWYNTVMEQLRTKTKALQTLYDTAKSNPNCDNELIKSTFKQMTALNSTIANRVQQHKNFAELKNHILTVNDSIRNIENWVQNKPAINSLEDAFQYLADLEAKNIETNEKLQPQVLKINTTFNELKDTCAIENGVKDQLECLNKGWSKLNETLEREKSKHKNATDSIEHSRIHIADMLLWLKELFKQLPSSEIKSITKSADLFELKTTCQKIVDRMETRMAEYEKLINTAKETSLPSKDPSKNLSTQSNELTHEWNLIWNEATTHVQSLQKCSDTYAKYRILLAQQSDWLDRLERRLARASSSSADAEDFSEELDDLENYINNDEVAVRVNKLKSSVAELEQNVCQFDSELNINAILERYERLREQATQRVSQLETYVKEAQQNDETIRQFRSWLEHTDNILSARLDNDLTADDLPDDDKMLAGEFEIHEKQLLEIEEYALSFKKKSPGEAAEKFEDRVKSLKVYFDRVKQIYERFRITDSFESRLSRSFRQLREIRDAACLLDPASSDIDGIEGQLKHCLKFYRTLSELKPEITDVIKVGRKLVENRDVSDPAELSNRIDSLKELYNILGAQVTKAKQTLEQALNLLRSVHEREHALSAWLDRYEHQQRSSSHRVDDFDNMNKQMTQLMVDYEKFCKMCDPVYSHTLKESITKLRSRWQYFETHFELNKWLAPSDDVGTIKPVITMEHPRGLVGTPVKTNEVTRNNTPDEIDSINRLNGRVNMPDVVQTTEQNPKDDYKNSTFNLTQTSELFSDISNDKLLFKRSGDNDNDASTSNSSKTSDKSYLSNNEQPFHLVEVRELETPTSLTTQMEIYPSISMQSPEQAVEMVEIIDAESIESIPDASLHEQPTIVSTIDNTIPIADDINDHVTVHYKLKKEPGSYQKTCVKDVRFLHEVRSNGSSRLNEMDLISSNQTNGLKANKKNGFGDRNVIFDSSLTRVPISIYERNRKVNDSVKQLNMDAVGEHSILDDNVERNEFENDVSFASSTPKSDSSSRSSNDTVPVTNVDDSTEFEHHAKMMFKRMDAMLNVISNVNKNEGDPSHRLELINTELSLLAPDAATLISRGDTLVLHLHSKNPQKAEQIRSETLSRLRTGYARVRDEANQQRSHALLSQKLLDDYKTRLPQLNDVRDWLMGLPSRISLANNQEKELKRLEEEFSKKGQQLDSLTNLSSELHSHNVIHDDKDLNIIKNKWQQVTKKVQHLFVSSCKNQDKFSPGLDMKSFSFDLDPSLARFVTSLDAIIFWVMEMKTRINISSDLSQPERDKVMANLGNAAMDRADEVKEIIENYKNLQPSPSQPVAVELKEKIKKLQEDWDYVRNFNKLLISAAQKQTITENDPNVDKSNDQSNMNGKKSDALSTSNACEVDKSTDAKIVDAKITSTISSVKASFFTSTSSLASLRSANRTPRHSLTPINSSIEITAALLASVDQSISQIKDYLDSEEEMLRQQVVVVSDIEEIMQLIDKQKKLEQDRHQLKRHFENIETEYEARVTELQNDLKDLHDKYDTRETNFKRWEREKNQLIAELQSQNSRLTAQIKDTSTLQQQLNSQIHELREQKSLHRVSFHEQSSTLDTFKSELDLTIAQKDELQQSLMEVASDRDQLAAALEDSEQRIMVLERYKREQDGQLQLLRKELEHVKLLGKVSSSEPYSILHPSHKSLANAKLTGPRSLLAEMECDEIVIDWRPVYRQLRELCQQLKSQREDDDSGMHSDCSTTSLDGDTSLNSGVGVLVEAGQELVRLVLDTDTVRLLERLESARREIRERDDELTRRSDLVRDLQSRLSVKEVELQVAIEERDRARNDMSASSLDRDEVLKQARELRDSAMARKNKAEVELAKNRVDLMQVNSQLLEAIQQKVELSQQLDQWQIDMQELLDELMRSKLTSQQPTQPSAPPRSKRNSSASRLLNLFNR